MKIERINGYCDNRFSKKVLRQHGAFLVDGMPYEVEILDMHRACVRGNSEEMYDEVIEAFRLFSEHITVFTDSSGRCLKQYPDVKLFQIPVLKIQPSQFYVDDEKLDAVSTFVKNSSDVIIPVIKDENVWVSIDGHTRLMAALRYGIENVYAYEVCGESYIKDFVKEARKRKIYCVKDMLVLPRETYEEKWIKYCEIYFGE